MLYIWYSPSSQAVQSDVDLVFQYSLSGFLMISGHACMFFISVVFKSSSTSSLHLLYGLPLQLLPSILAVAICIDILWFCFLSTWSYHLRERDFYKFYSSSCNVSLFLLSSVLLLLWAYPYIFFTFPLSNIWVHLFLLWSLCVFDIK